MAGVDREPRSISRRSLLGTGFLALANAACQKSEAAGLPNRIFLPENSRRAYGMSNGGVAPREVPTPTPEPTRTPLPEGAYYAPWPEDARLKNQLNKFQIMDGVSLVIARAAPPDEPTCTGICYRWNTRHVWSVGQRPTMVDDLRHELGHAHQQWITTYNNPEGVRDWIDTQEGRDFVKAYDQYSAYYRSQGGVIAYPSELGYFENFPNLISDWYRGSSDPKDPQNLPYLGEFIKRFPR